MKRGLLLLGKKPRSGLGKLSFLGPLRLLPTGDNFGFSYRLS